MKHPNKPKTHTTKDKKTDTHMKKMCRLHLDKVEKVTVETLDMIFENAKGKQGEPLSHYAYLRLTDEAGKKLRIFIDPAVGCWFPFRETLEFFGVPGNPGLLIDKVPAAHKEKRYLPKRDSERQDIWAVTLSGLNALMTTAAPVKKPALDALTAEVLLPALSWSSGEVPFSKRKLKTWLGKARHTIHRLEKENHQMTVQKGALLTGMTTFREARDKALAEGRLLQDALDAAETECLTLRQALKEAETNAMQQAADKQSLEKRFASLEARIKTLTAENTAQAETITKLHRACDSLYKDKQDCEQQYAALKVFEPLAALLKDIHTISEAAQSNALAMHRLSPTTEAMNR